MKKMMLVAVMLLGFITIARADICSDIKSAYDNKLATLLRDTEAALRLTTDPMELEAIQQSYLMQRDQLLAEMEAALLSAGCVEEDVPPPPPPDPVVPPPPPDPVVPPPPPDPVVPPPTPKPDPETPPTPGDDDDGNQAACREQLNAYKAELLSQNLRHNEFVAKMKLKIEELNCGHYGHWRRTQKGPTHQHQHKNQNKKCGK